MSSPNRLIFKLPQVVPVVLPEEDEETQDNDEMSDVLDEDEDEELGEFDEDQDGEGEDDEDVVDDGDGTDDEGAMEWEAEAERPREPLLGQVIDYDVANLTVRLHLTNHAVR
jgi:hypothetical protein